MPEAELRAYLRIFIPEERIEDVLDQVALGGLEVDAREEWQLFELAHREVARDERVTPDLEAAVLLEEVGLAPEDVNRILSSDTGPSDAEQPPGPEPPGDEPPRPEPLDAGPSDSSPQPEPEVSDAEPDERSQDVDPGGDPTQGSSPAVRVEPSGTPWRLVMVAILLAILAVFLTVAVFTDAGQERLARLGLPPQVWVGVMVGLMAGGLAFLAAETAMGSRDTPVEDAEEDSPQ